MRKQPTVREINSHLASMTSYCYVFIAGAPTVRIARARTRKGVVEGRVICGSPNTWVRIPSTASVELS